MIIPHFSDVISCEGREIILQGTLKNSVISMDNPAGSSMYLEKVFIAIQKK
jgi:hypothetical protein